MKIKYLIIFLVLTINCIISANEINLQLLENFKHKNFKKLEDILKSKNIEEEQRILFHGMIFALKKDFDRALLNFDKLEKDGTVSKKIRIIATYLKETLKILEGFKEYLEQLECDYYDNLIEGDYVKSYYVINKMVELDPSNPEYRLKLARVALYIDHPHLSIVQASLALNFNINDKILAFNSIYTIGMALRQSYFNEYTPYYKLFQEFPSEQKTDSFGMRQREKVGIGLVPFRLLEKAIERLLEISDDPEISNDKKREINVIIQQLRLIIQERKKERDEMRQ